MGRVRCRTWIWHLGVDGSDGRESRRSMLRLGGVAALARAQQRRQAAVAAQTERMTAEKAAIAKAHEDAKAHGLVEKTAGESGAAGVLRNKWAKWLGSNHGGDVAARLAAEGGAPTVEETKLFSTWVYQTRQKLIVAKGRAAVCGLR